MYPLINPIRNLIASIVSINDIGAFSAIKISNISSLVDRYIDINDPSDIILVIYRFVAITPKPHCGINPSRPPSNGPNLPAFFNTFSFHCFNSSFFNALFCNSSSIPTTSFIYSTPFFAQISARQHLSQ